MSGLKLARMTKPPSAGPLAGTHDSSGPASRGHNRAPGRIVALGEALIDMVSLVPSGSTYERAAGGAPANVAVGAARLGVPAGFIGKVGADPFGRYLKETLAGEGVDTTHLTDTPGHNTAVAIVTLGHDGQREFQFYREAAADLQLGEADVDAEYVAQAAILHVGSLSMTAEPARRATLRALTVARERGVTVSLDPNLRLDQWPDARTARSVIFDLLPYASVVKVSEEELEFLTGSTDLSAAGSLLDHGPRLVCVTRGPLGADYAIEGHTGRVAGFAVEAIDTTGAGDAFVAALLTNLRHAPDLYTSPGPLEAAIRRANAYAASSVTRRGAIPAMPTSAELEAFLQGAS